MQCMFYSPSLWLILLVVQICMNECQCVFCPEHFLLASIQPCWHLLQIIAKYSWFNGCGGPTSEGDVCNKSRQDKLIKNTNQIVFAHIMERPYRHTSKMEWQFLKCRCWKSRVQEHITCIIFCPSPFFLPSLYSTCDNSEKIIAKRVKVSVLILFRQITMNTINHSVVAPTVIANSSTRKAWGIRGPCHHSVRHISLESCLA